MQIRLVLHDIGNDECDHQKSDFRSALVCM